MDKYQEYLFNFSGSYYRLSVCGKSSLEKVVFEDKIIFKQNEDITITDYIFYVANMGIESVFAITNSKETPLAQELDSQEKSKNRFLLPIDFNDKIDAIKIIFKNNLADDLILPVLYEEADKEKYYAKKEQERKDGLRKAAAITHSTGADLVNIYFQPCCDEYEYTEIYLYIPQSHVTVGSPHGPVKKPSSWQLFKKCKVDAEDLYKSINGLAYGTYAYVIKQFDKKGNLLLKTEYITFSLKAPESPLWII